jgi:hypothetical protein
MSLVPANFGRSAQEPDLQVVRTEVRPTIQSVILVSCTLGSAVL